MNLSRLAALAVILMMVLSAFVAIPTYNARADHDNHDDHDHDDHGDDDDHGLPSFSELDENGNGTIEFSEMLVICPEDQSEEQCRGIFDQYSGDDDAIDENEYQTFVSQVTGPDDGHHSMMVCYNIDTHEVDFSITSQEDCDAAGLMWVSSNSGPDDNHGRDWQFDNYNIHVKMESLGEWLVKIQTEWPVDGSNEMRQEVSEMCENMLGANAGEITQECYDHWLTMSNHNDHDDYHGCPPGLSEEDCEVLQECQNANSGFNMSCVRLMYNYCYENPNMCGDESEDNGDNHPDHHDNDEGHHHHGDEDYHHEHDGDDGFSHADYDLHHNHEDDDSAFFNAFFAYEAGHITAEEFMQSPAMQDWIDDTGMDDTDGNDDDGGNDDDSISRRCLCLELGTRCPP